jgi:hypothetical protein
MSLNWPKVLKWQGSDASAQKLLDMMKTSVEAAQKQATELQALSSKVATMSTKQNDNQTHERQERNRDARSGDRRTIRQRPLKPTPQNIQRINYTRQANSQTTPMRSFRAPARDVHALNAVYYTRVEVARRTDSSADAAGVWDILRGNVGRRAAVRRRGQRSSDGVVGDRGHYPLAAGPCLE